MKIEFPGNIIRVDDICGDKFEFGSKRFMAPLNHLIPLEEKTKTEGGNGMSYKERQRRWIEENNIVKGTKLKIVRSAEDREDGWGNSWMLGMEAMVGEVVTFSDSMVFGPIVGCEGFRVDESCYNYPYFVFELAETKRQKDIRLLKESEKKWVGIVYDGKKDGGAVDCPCCNEYMDCGKCGDCPIGDGCRGIGHVDWCEYAYDLDYTVFDAKSEALASNVLSNIGDIRRKLEKEEEDSKEKETLDCYEYMVNGKPTGIKVGEYLHLEIGEVKSGDKIPRSTLITLDSFYSSSRSGCAGTPTGFISDGPDVLKEHFKRNGDGSIEVCVY